MNKKRLIGRNDSSAKKSLQFFFKKIRPVGAILSHGKKIKGQRKAKSFFSNNMEDLFSTKNFKRIKKLSPDDQLLYLRNMTTAMRQNQRRKTLAALEGEPEDIKNKLIPNLDEIPELKKISISSKSKKKIRAKNKTKAKSTPNSKSKTRSKSIKESKTSNKDDEEIDFFADLDAPRPSGGRKLVKIKKNPWYWNYGRVRRIGKETGHDNKNYKEYLKNAMKKAASKWKGEQPGHGIPIKVLCKNVRK